MEPRAYTSGERADEDNIMNLVKKFKDYEERWIREVYHAEKAEVMRTVNEGLVKFVSIILPKRVADKLRNPLLEERAIVP